MKFKKILSLICAISMLATMFVNVGVSAIADGPTFTVETVEVTQGEGTATVDVAIDFAGEMDVAAAQLQVTYDSAIKVTGSTQGDALDGTFSKVNVARNPINVQYLNMDGETVKLTTGRYITFACEVPISAAGEYPITLVVKKIGPSSTEDLSGTITVVNGKITVLPGEPEPEPVVLKSIAVAPAALEVAHNAVVDKAYLVEAGVKVTATYSDDTTKEVTDWTYADGKITYTEGDTTVEAAIEITVLPAPVVLKSIAVNPAALEVAHDAVVDKAYLVAAGVKVTATYSDDTTKEVTGWTYADGKITYAEGDATVEATIEITVLPAPVYGDVDGDDKVTNLDLMILERYAADWEGYTIVEANADLDADGNPAQPADIAILARHRADWAGYETLPYITEE